ncbi:oxidoreductase [Kineococcus aurantiacus]|uniref:Aryl-alcohol dehydrogenase-like predicted oxidoreductase n=1 Tax=Kineococcus aurantiacus TaxID=37633 RepID=A0A7Y9DJS2_9ACTN|nr:aryl-alcohol dehydrogenase-like predicted oxidoreductase [Kineococcus aurantiacus]
MSTTSTDDTTSSTPTALPGGTWTLGDRQVTRFGYGAMQLAGPGVLGPPADHDGALAVLRAAVRAGITHVDTSGAYGPRVTNELIREALHPYPQPLLIATKVGADRDARGGWPTARRPEDLRRQVQDNLHALGVETLDLVNLRAGDATGPQAGSIAEAFETLAQLQQDGLIAHLGVSNVTAEQVAEARAVAPVVCVQNLYNLAVRHDDDLLDDLARDGIAYVPFFPLGGFTPLQSQALSAVAQRLAVTPTAVALSWLLQRSANVLLIPGTRSVTHLRENVAGAGTVLSEQDLAELDAIGG